jgi:DsbC/DsbD-like thiol-disulfide interchange protein
MSVFWIMQARTVLRMMLAGVTASIIALALPAGPASAKASRVEAVEVELVADRDAVVAGQPITLGLRIRHDPKWHTYWRNPGDSGLPTLFPLELPAGYVAGPVQWPAT